MSLQFYTDMIEDHSNIDTIDYKPYFGNKKILLISDIENDDMIDILSLFDKRWKVRFNIVYKNKKELNDFKKTLTSDNNIINELYSSKINYKVIGYFEKSHTRHCVQGHNHFVLTLELMLCFEKIEHVDHFKNLNLNLKMHMKD